MNEEVINQDEIDALLGQENQVNSDEPQSFDFVNQTHLLKTKLPNTSALQESFMRSLTKRTIDFVKRKASVELIDTSVESYDEFIKSQFNPTYLNLISLDALPGEMIVSLDAHLLFTLVENYFGGEGKLSGKNEGREFTPTETRISKMYLNEILQIYEKVWSDVASSTARQVKLETNPVMANFCKEETILICYKFKITLEGGAGDLVIAYPYSTMEKISEYFADRTVSQLNQPNAQWSESLKQDALGAPIDISCRLVKQKISLKTILNLKRGDVIPIDIPDLSVLTASGIPIFHGKFGVHENNYAFKVIKNYSSEG